MADNDITGPAVCYGENNIEKIYYGEDQILQVYHGINLVYAYNPYPVDTVLANVTGQAGSVTLYSGVYEMKTASAGGGGSWVSGWWCNYHSSGGSGAVWEGTFRYSGPEKTLAWTAATYKSGSQTITFDGATWLTLTGGGSGDHQYGGSAGVLTINNNFTPYIRTTSIALNGTQGYGTTESGGSSHSGVTATKSTMGWGKGSGSNDSGGSSGGFYLRLVSL